MSSNNNENNASAKPAGSTINQTLAAADFEIPWVEKYRPQRIEDIVGNEEAVLRLKAIAEDGNMPNLILAGPPGIGKTTSVLCLAHALLGKDFKEAVLELNASDERTLDVVRTKIKNFAQKKVTLPPGRHKIVILDEADSMTKESQQAMRRTMEIYSNSTRFALACNNSSDIIEPIQSRCAILRFSRLSDHQILKRLIEVCDQEKVNYTEDGLQALIFTAEGDLRNALNNLQSTHAGFGLVNAENVFKVCDHPHPMIVKQIIEHCINYELMNAQEKLTYLIHRGYSPQDIISTFFRVVRSYDMSEDRQIEFMKEIGNTHVRVLDGVETPLQMSGLLARLCKLAKAPQ